MAFRDSFFNCLDNTGVKKVKCLKIYKRNISYPSALVLVTLKKVLPHRKVKKGQLYKGVVVRLVKSYLRFDASMVKYYVNSIIILKKNELVPLGTRIYGSVFYEVRLKGFMKIVTLSLFLV